MDIDFTFCVGGILDAREYCFLYLRGSSIGLRGDLLLMLAPLLLVLDSQIVYLNPVGSAHLLLLKWLSH